MMRKQQRGQSTAEYAIVLGVVIAALVGMQIYVKRGLNAKMKGVTDYMADNTTGLAGKQLEQYEPYYASSKHAVTQKTIADNSYEKGKAVRALTSDTTTRTGSSTTGVDLTKDDLQWQ